MQYTEALFAKHDKRMCMTMPPPHLNKRTNFVGASPNVNKDLYCSNVKNLIARLGASAVIGGRIPLYRDSNLPRSAALKYTDQKR